MKEKEDGNLVESKKIANFAALKVYGRVVCES